MSKLDYVTIAIVGICIMAILFLVYKMTNVFNGDNGESKTEIAAGGVESEDDSVYDYEIDENVDSVGTAANKGSSASDKSTATRPATTSVPADKAETSAAETLGEDETTSGGSTKPTKSTASAATDAVEKSNFSEGKYLVLAGSFSQKALAERQVDKLNKMGYDNARVEIFDRGKYAVVLVDRFGNMAEAEKLVKKLTDAGVKSYVKAKS